MKERREIMMTQTVSVDHVVKSYKSHAVDERLLLACFHAINDRGAARISDERSIFSCLKEKREESEVRMEEGHKPF